ncbi:MULTISPECIES: hypothetical protein [Flavobacterium]|nr:MULTISPECIES: hypothetical protein [Flavobacterium]MDP5200225.1 hypothetical protein [Flavobacterium sp. DG2-3]
MIFKTFNLQSVVVGTEYKYQNKKQIYQKSDLTVLDVQIPASNEKVIRR